MEIAPKQLDTRQTTGVKRPEANDRARSVRIPWDLMSRYLFGVPSSDLLQAQARDRLHWDIKYGHFEEPGGKQIQQHGF